MDRRRTPSGKCSIALSMFDTSAPPVPRRSPSGPHWSQERITPEARSVWSRGAVSRYGKLVSMVSISNGVSESPRAVPAYVPAHPLTSTSSPRKRETADYSRRRTRAARPIRSVIVDKIGHRAAHARRQASPAFHQATSTVAERSGSRRGGCVRETNMLSSDAGRAPLRQCVRDEVGRR